MFLEWRWAPSGEQWDQDPPGSRAGNRCPPCPRRSSVAGIPGLGAARLEFWCWLNLKSQRKRESGGSHELQALPSTYSQRNQGNLIPPQPLWAKPERFWIPASQRLGKPGTGWDHPESPFFPGCGKSQEGTKPISPGRSWLLPLGIPSPFSHQRPPSQGAGGWHFWDWDWECCSWQGRPHRVLSQHHPAPWYLPGSPPLGAQN